MRLRLFKKGLISVCVFAHVAIAQDKKTADSEAASSGLVETSCATDIYYTWKRVIKKTTWPQDPKKKDDPIPVEAFYRRISAKALGEDAAKIKLNEEIPLVSSQALNSCREEHTDSAGCIGNELKKNSAQYALLDFESRRALLQAIADDCDSQFGTCLSTRAGDVTCEAVADATVATEDKKGADKKKK